VDGVASAQRLSEFKSYVMESRPAPEPAQDPPREHPRAEAPAPAPAAAAPPAAPAAAAPAPPAPPPPATPAAEPPAARPADPGADARAAAASTSGSGSGYSHGAGPLPETGGTRPLREARVPSSALGRVWGFGSLAANLVAGTITEAVSRPFRGGDAGARPGSVVLTPRNAEVLAEGLCRMRGAALKLGQMLSIQDPDTIPPEIQAALERVRQGADVMPESQLTQVLREDLGEDWRRLFRSFDPAPIAAASIGQVHRAELPDGTPVAVKVQYPGVAQSIHADIDNLMRMMRVANVFPRGLFVEQAVAVAKKELSLECDYEYEAAAQERFRELVLASPDLARDVEVPEVFPAACGKRVLTSRLVPGVPIDRVAGMDQATRDSVGTRLLRLTLRELFDWRLMQTDPNWGNFLYDPDSGKVYLIDFGAAKEYPKGFVDDYVRMVRACAERDADEVVLRSARLGFLTGDESQVMLDAHTQAGFVVGEPFAAEGDFDFGAHQGLTRRVGQLGSVMLKHRLAPPPEEAYSLHRKLSGAFLASIKIRARVPCRALFYEVWDRYEFGDGGGGAADPEVPAGTRATGPGAALAAA